MSFIFLPFQSDAKRFTAIFADYHKRERNTKKKRIRMISAEMRCHAGQVINVGEYKKGEQDGSYKTL
jgi:hypothetical protein